MASNMSDPEESEATEESVASEETDDPQLEAPFDQRMHAESMIWCYTIHVADQRDLCRRIVAIVTSHPENTMTQPEDHVIGDMHYSRSLDELDSMKFPDIEVNAENALLLPKVSDEACNSPAADGERPPPKTNTYMRRQYRKICKAIGSKWEQMFPRKIVYTDRLIYNIILGMKEVEFDIALLEKALESLQKALKTPGVKFVVLKSKINSAYISVSNAESMYMVTVDYMLSYNKKLRTYVKDRLPRRSYLPAPLAQLPERLAPYPVNPPEDPQLPSTSKRMPERAKKESRDKKSKMSENVVGSDSDGETSKDTISGQVYESVEGMALSESVGDKAEKSRPKSTVKQVGTKITGTKPKTRAVEEVTEPKDAVAKNTRAKTEGKHGGDSATGTEPEIAHDCTKTGTKPKIKRDDKKTAAKPKKVRVQKTPTKSKRGYSKVPSDSD